MSRLVDLRVLDVVHRIARTGEQHHGKGVQDDGNERKGL